MVRPEDKKPKPVAKTAPKTGGMISGGSMISSAPPKVKKPTAEELADIPKLFRPKSYSKPTREEALKRTDGLANGFVLLDVASKGAEEAWSWVIDGKDEPTICNVHREDQTDGQSMILSYFTNSLALSQQLPSPISSMITVGGSGYLYPTQMRKKKRRQRQKQKRSRSRRRRTGREVRLR